MAGCGLSSKAMPGCRVTCCNVSPSFRPNFATESAHRLGARHARCVAAAVCRRAVLFGGAVGSATQPTPPGRLRLEIYPGMACGTGRHPATQLCLQAIERYVKPGASGVGCGLGIGHSVRCRAADGRRLAWSAAISIPTRFDIARERVRVPMFVGSADAVRSQWADVIVANIDAATLELIAAELERVRKPESTLILSGFPEWDVPEGFSPKEILQLGRVALLHLRERNAPQKKKPTEHFAPWAFSRIGEGICYSDAGRRFKVGRSSSSVEVGRRSGWRHRSSEATCRCPIRARGAAWDGSDRPGYRPCVCYASPSNALSRR